MYIQFLDQPTLETLWAANERELLRLATLSPRDREVYAGREDELLDAQDAIELRLGIDVTNRSRLASAG